jgi:hypothetical protein
MNRWTAAWRTGGRFSPRYLVQVAVALSAMYMVMHLLGLRAYTNFLSGTFADGSPTLSAFIGTVYVLLYFLAVVYSPILLLTAAILWLVRVPMTRVQAAPAVEQAQPEEPAPASVMD